MTINLTVVPPNGRLCGDRQQDGAYLCVGLADEGTPLLDFVFDPALPWDGDAFRGAKTIKRRTGIVDVVMWVGAENYPFVSDFVEEASRFGVSKRIPKNFDFSQLSPESRLILAHPRTIPWFEYEAGPNDFVKRWCGFPNALHECTYNLWGLSALHDFGDKHAAISQLPDYMVTIKCPSFQYNVHVPKSFEGDYSSPVYKQVEHGATLRYQTGIFIALPITHVEYVNREGKAPANLAAKCDAAGIPLAVVKE